MGENITLLETMLLGSSIRKLDRVGSGSREEQYYAELSSYLDVNLVEYPLNRNKYIASLYMPLKYGLRYRQNDKTRTIVVRSKQFWGSWCSLLMAKILHCVFIMRLGYIWSKSFAYDRGHAWPNNKWYSRFEKWMMGFATAYQFSSIEAYEYFKDLVGDRKFEVIPNGFNTALFKDQKIHRDIDYLIIGRNVPIKRIEPLVQHLKGTVVVVGSGSRRIEEQPRPGLHVSCIEFIDNRELPEIMNRAKHVCSASLTEGNPKSTIEAILCGCFPILSDIPAHRELISELGYGKLFNNLEDALTVGEINDDCLKHFAQSYSFETVCNKEFEFIKHVCQR